MSRVWVFVDFWNFQLAWNRSSGGKSCNWAVLPRVLIRQTGELFLANGVQASLSLERTVVYASVDPDQNANLRRWLTDKVQHFPGFDVRIRDRQARRTSIYCPLCKTDTGACPNCGEPYVGSPEKGIDAAIVTDLLALAWEGVWDVAVLISSDADFIPAVERVQQRGLKVVNAAWRNRGHELQRVCWGSFPIDAIKEDLCR